MIAGGARSSHAIWWPSKRSIYRKLPPPGRS